LLELAAARVDGLIKPEHRYICTAEAYRGVIAAQLDGFGDEQILGEPVPRDTVNAVGFAAAVLAKKDPEAVFAVLTADHVIEPEATFRERMDLAFRLVEHDPRRLVTFAITPTYAATGFGYVERGAPVRDRSSGKRAAIDGQKEQAYYVARFVEKPDVARAQVYVESGDFAWNSGMFVWRAQTFLDALKAYRPESHEGLMKVQAAWGTKKQKAVLDEVYPTLPKISVDYAVLEPAAKEAVAAREAGQAGEGGGGGGRFPIVTVQTDVKWLDVGSWPSFAQTVEADERGNRASGEGRVITHECKNTLVVAGKGHTVAVLGVDDLIVVHTPDATLVMPRARAEELKQVHGLLGPELR
jgi:mannose-1-phosphate guanylyltransferase